MCEIMPQSKAIASSIWKSPQRLWRFYGIDELGLDDWDRLYFRTLIEKFKGRAGLKALAIALTEDERTVSEVYEPYYIKLGFLALTPTGRVATEVAHGHLGYETSQRFQRTFL